MYSATGLRELLLACEKYSKEHAIIYNSKKSSVLICKNRATLHVPSPSFAVNDIAIGQVAKVKYLGHVITNDMTDDADMMRQRPDMPPGTDCPYAIRILAFFEMIRPYHVVIRI